MQIVEAGGGFAAVAERVPRRHANAIIVALWAENMGVGEFVGGKTCVDHLVSWCVRYVAKFAGAIIRNRSAVGLDEVRRIAVYRVAASVALNLWLCLMPRSSS
jgi:hypothetical protein